MNAEMGLRELKKRQTRERIIECALGLFAERGFERVRVAEIARAAQVSEATVFNYFATKEDLVYNGMEAFEERLIEVIRGRPEGTTVVGAFRDHILRPRGALASDDPALIEQIATTARIIAGSPSLQNRERQIFDRATRALADLIAAESGAPPHDVEPWVIANALIGVNRAMTHALHRHVLDGGPDPDLAADIIGQGRRALDTLIRGLPAR